VRVAPCLVRGPGFIDKDYRLSDFAPRSLEPGQDGTLAQAVRPGAGTSQPHLTSES
jgi:hypothetical protein